MAAFPKSRSNVMIPKVLSTFSKTFLAPTLPEPIFVMSLPFTSFVTMYAEGNPPIRYMRKYNPRINIIAVIVSKYGVWIYKTFSKAFLK